MPTQTALNSEEIMERLLRICPQATIAMRPKFPSGPYKWCVSTPLLVYGGIETGGYGGVFVHDESGATPEETLQNTWKGVLSMAENKNIALVRLNCPRDVNIPGDEPQVWVRWNFEKDDWEE